eukprot:CAMPEP_0194360394 /NCGR_PEP_ID=MMETSP0174-20130528/7719_1 /TAXON_ID=216777 /ORGANISM="Proboscia alata, Strain PI-D3" /LENGTH=108 /DNA_ID=CAMNT_0039131851 /DNA_START=1522 /DNA_END=1848 /DNA_ORIENTATION=-
MAFKSRGGALGATGVTSQHPPPVAAGVFEGRSAAIPRPLEVSPYRSRINARCASSSSSLVGIEMVQRSESVGFKNCCSFFPFWYSTAMGTSPTPDSTACSEFSSTQHE